MENPSVSQSQNSRDPRFGLHYYPDTLHYREADLQAWLPDLVDLGTSWLVLRSDVGRAIPEPFLRELKQSGIEPVIQFQLAMDRLPDAKEIGMLFDVYARWGARYAIFFDRPNTRASWPAASWVQQDLVERFLDLYIPTANLAVQNGLTPVFPPLEPGGSYWDTAFLRSALQALQRRRQEALLSAQALSAYAWAGGRSLNWGAGGPDQWPQARPYQSAQNGQDQRGFRIYEWYEAIARDVLHRDCSILLLQAGRTGTTAAKQAAVEKSSDSVQSTAGVYENIARVLAGEKVLDPQDGDAELAAIPDYVTACNFWLMSAAENSALQNDAWFREPGARNPVAERIHAWKRDLRAKNFAQSTKKSAAVNEPCIQHYLLLPGIESGMADWYLEVIRPFVKKYHPTIGFSPDEASLAARVTVVGNTQNFPEDLLDRLQEAGCCVDLIHGDGTKIATELAER